VPRPFLHLPLPSFLEEDSGAIATALRVDLGCKREYIKSCPIQRLLGPFYAQNEHNPKGMATTQTSTKARVTPM
jgi:hypothetical protein